jgi:hypothetical protein
MKKRPENFIYYLLAALINIICQKTQITLDIHSKFYYFMPR